MTSTNRLNKTDILISGGGIPGLMAALFLAGKGLQVTVIDPATDKLKQKPDAGCQTTAFMNGSVALLKKAGVWESCQGDSAPLETLRIIDSSAKRQDSVIADFNAADIDKPQFAMNIPNNLVLYALLQQTRANKNIKLIAAKLSGLALDETRAEALLDNGDTVHAKLVIGADGRNSAVREQAGIDAHTKEYGQKAITCLLRHSKPHGNVSTEFHRPTGPFTIVPLPDNRASIVWVDNDEAADQYMAMNKTAFLQTLQDKTNGVLGEVALENGPQSFPLVLLKARRLVTNRVALTAEAAHVLHPMGAQGLNLSLRDVAALVDTIQNAMKLGLDYGSMVVLEKYEKQRQHDIKGRVMGTDGLVQMLCTHSFFLQAMRRKGLKAANTITPLKKFLMHEGLGH